ncbi:uncharacterized protein C2orf15 homolog isoform X1 [Equus asinus]|uniref:uncharacterized protein C2orf15 homolog isoform X1 n=1 Tax=Equus asinus TaxID=9793 RepID=UPI0038F7631E
MRRAVSPLAAFPRLWNTCCLAAAAVCRFSKGSGTIPDPRSVNSLLLRAALGAGRLVRSPAAARGRFAGSFAGRVLLLQPLGREPTCSSERRQPAPCSLGSLRTRGCSQPCTIQAGLNREVAERPMKAQIPDR